MDTEISRTVGVIVERRPAKSRWVDHVWRVVEVLDGGANVAPFTRLAEFPDGTERYFAGNTELTLHRTETEAYQTNLARDRRLYAVLRPGEGGAHPLSLHTVTASPDAASEFLESNEELVEAVPMPPPIQAWAEAFCVQHHKEQPFQKRRRDDVDVEKLKFSKEPIFAGRRKARTGEPDKSDG